MHQNIFKVFFISALLSTPQWFGLEAIRIAITEHILLYIIKLTSPPLALTGGKLRNKVRFPQVFSTSW